MRPVGLILALASHRAVEFADTGGVGHLAVNLHLIGVEPLGESNQDSLNEPPVLGWQVNAVESVVAIARISEDGLGESQAAKVSHDLVQFLLGPLLLLVSRIGIRG